MRLVSGLWVRWRVLLKSQRDTSLECVGTGPKSKYWVLETSRSSESRTENVTLEMPLRRNAGEWIDWVFLDCVTWPVYFADLVEQRRHARAGDPVFKFDVLEDRSARWRRRKCALVRV